MTRNTPGTKEKETIYPGHLANAMRMGVKEAGRMYARFLDDSKDLREAAEIYHFLEKTPRLS